MSKYARRSFVIACFLIALAESRQAHAQTTILFLDSQPGDYVGGGQQITITPATGAFSASRNFDNVVSVFVNAVGGFWSLNFAAPGDAPLAIATYDNATRWPLQAPVSPGLDVTGQGRGCNTSTGSFVVREVGYGPSGDVVAFAADFEQHCEASRRRSSDRSGSTPRFHSRRRLRRRPTARRRS
jgi:hypothetical protein